MRFFVGLDLGQAADYTALSVLEQIGDSPNSFTDYYRRRALGITEPPLPPMCHVRHLERFPLGTPYPAVVDRVRRLVLTDLLRGQYRLIADATGVGRPVVDLLRSAGILTEAVTITSGDTTSRTAMGWHVPKRDLVATVQILLQSGRLKFADTLPEVSTLVKELLAFQVKITAAANDIYGAWREGAHDDLVLSVALAAWYAEGCGGRAQL